MKLRAIFIIALLILSASGCKVEYDIRKPFSTMSEIPKLIPYQSTFFLGSNFPGGPQHYQLLLGDMEIPVTNVTSDSIGVFIPFEAPVGEWDVDLVYKGEKTRFGKVEVLDWKKIVPENVTYFKGDDPEYPYVISDESSNAIIPHFENGTLDKIYIDGINGGNSVLEVNDSGLPTFFYNDKVSIIFDGYNLEKGTVNVAQFPTGHPDSAKFDYGISLDKASIDAMQSFKNGRVNSDDVQQAFAIVGTVFNIAGCIIGFVPPLTVLTGGLAILSCGSAIYDAVKVINPDADNELASSVLSVHGIKMNLINCLSLVKKPTNAKDLYEGIYGCYGLALEAAKGADVLYTEYRKQLEREVKKMQDILATGYGDIKISLDWNSEADIDLWVIDPRGNKIYYDAPTSTTGGELDLDDTDGYGPENVFWPTDMAPLGKYKVQLHYFEPEEGAATSYRATIFNFGRTKTFTGTITYNQVVTIAEFEAGAEWGGSGGRGSREVVTMYRSLLPTKK